MVHTEVAEVVPDVLLTHTASHSENGVTRPGWFELPGVVRTMVETHAGGRVVSARSRPFGFSPGVAVHLTLEDRRHLFAKAVRSEPNPDAPTLYRQEIANHQIIRGLVAPSLSAHFELEDWVVLLFPFVDGAHPNAPPTKAQVEAIVDFISAQPAAPESLKSVNERFESELWGWRKLADARPRGLRPWAVRHARHCAGLEHHWTEAARGGRVIHADLRSDNIMMSSEGSVFVDWAFASRGHPLFDLVSYLLSAAAEGYAEADAALSRTVARLGWSAEAANVLLTAFTGWYLWLALQPPVAGIPTLRVFQSTMADAGSRWLAQRLGLS